MTSKEFADHISQFALEKKGDEIKVMDLTGINESCDFFVVITGTTDVHVRTIADHIEDRAAEYGVKLWHKEGYKNASWILLDFIDVVVHVFKPESRDFYNLDQLWADAKTKLVRDGVNS